MQLAELSRRALEFRSRYAALESAHGDRPWSRSELAQGFAGDVLVASAAALVRRVIAREEPRSDGVKPTVPMHPEAQRTAPRHARSA